MIETVCQRKIKCLGYVGQKVEFEYSSWSHFGLLYSSDYILWKYGLLATNQITDITFLDADFYNEIFEDLREKLLIHNLLLLKGTIVETRGLIQQYDEKYNCLHLGFCSTESKYANEDKLYNNKQYLLLLFPIEYDVDYILNVISKNTFDYSHLKIYCWTQEPYSNSLLNLEKIDLGEKFKNFYIIYGNKGRKFIDYSDYGLFNKFNTYIHKYSSIHVQSCE